MIENWNEISDVSDLDRIIEDSEAATQAIFKHSTRCFISKTVMNGFKNDWLGMDDKVMVHYLDLIKHRDLSNEIASRLGVIHQSPQLIVIKKGRVTAHSSHNAISITDLIVGES